jgi:hypothetical protein
VVEFVGIEAVGAGEIDVPFIGFNVEMSLGIIVGTFFVGRDELSMIGVDEFKPLGCIVGVLGPPIGGKDGSDVGPIISKVGTEVAKSLGGKVAFPCI